MYAQFETQNTHICMYFIFLNVCLHIPSNNGALIYTGSENHNGFLQMKTSLSNDPTKGQSELAYHL